MAVAEVPHRRAGDLTRAARFGRATRAVLPPVFSIGGFVVFMYHGLGIHEWLLRHADSPAVLEEPGWILIVLFVLAVAAAEGDKHFDVIALAVVQRISGSRAEVDQRVQATVNETITQRRLPPGPGRPGVEPS